MRPEAELLVACARTCMDSENAERVRRLLREDLDWAFLVHMADRHGLIPFLYRHLRGAYSEAVPRGILEQLGGAFRRNVERSLFLTDELLKILDLFVTHGVEAIPWKGPALAAFLYRDLTLRQFSDLDILIRKADISKAKQLLLRRGYRPQLDLTPLQERAYLWSWCEYVFTSGDGRVVELHWGVAPRYFSFPLDLGPLWERLEETIPLGGRPVRTLSPEDWLLTLCVHGTKHLWERLQWVVDVAELVRLHPGMDWARVLSQAQALGGARMILLGLGLTQELLGTALPEEISRKLRSDPAVRSLIADMRECLFRETTSPPGLFQRTLFHLRARERLGDRARYCLRLAVTLSPGDLTSWSFPSFLFPLYYFLRPIRLMKKYGSITHII